MPTLVRCSLGMTYMSTMPLVHQPELAEPGHLLLDLEKRQDDVLEQLDNLDAQLIEVLKGLGVSDAEPSEDELE